MALYSFHSNLLNPHARANLGSMWCGGHILTEYRFNFLGVVSIDIHAMQTKCTEYSHSSNHHRQKCSPTLQKYSSPKSQDISPHITSSAMIAGSHLPTFQSPNNTSSNTYCHGGIRPSSKALALPLNKFCCGGTSICPWA